MEFASDSHGDALGGETPAPETSNAVPKPQCVYQCRKSVFGCLFRPPLGLMTGQPPFRSAKGWDAGRSAGTDGRRRGQRQHLRQTLPWRADGRHRHGVRGAAEPVDRRHDAAGDDRLDRVGKARGCMIWIRSSSAHHGSTWPAQLLRRDVSCWEKQRSVLRIVTESPEQAGPDGSTTRSLG